MAPACPSIDVEKNVQFIWRSVMACIQKVKHKQDIAYRVFIKVLLYSFSK